MGNPLLREKNNLIDSDQIKSESIARLILDLKDSMKHYGGIGIAAPQIGVNLQIAIIEIPETNRYGEKISLPLTIFINPEITILSEEIQGFWEGCLSVPGLRGFVERPKEIRVSYLDEFGFSQELIANGFLATVLQHELDHLEGILYLDRMKDLTKLMYQEEYESFITANTKE